MVSEGNQLTENFKPLRAGFIWSLVSLCLLALMGIGLSFSDSGYASIPFFFPFFEFVLPFLVLFVWAYGAHKRVEGWKQVGQKSTADNLSFSWKMNFFLILPLPFIMFFLGLFWFPIFFFLWAVVISSVWGYSTVCEARGLKKLEEENKVSLGISRICSLAAIVVYVCSVVVGLVDPMTHFLFSGFLIFYLFPRYFPVFPSSMVFASPFLMVSCINAIIQLKQVSVPQTAKETPDPSPIESLSA
jgi:hypothetical protein